MDSALGLALPRPPAGALVLALAHRARAGPASDALVAAVEQLVVGHAVAGHIAPRVLARPARERVDLHVGFAVLVIIALEDLDRAAALRLIAPQARDPGVEPSDRALRRLHLADRAALVRIRLVELEAVPLLLLRDREQGPEDRQLDAVLGDEPLLERLRLLEEIVGVDREDGDIGANAHGHIDERAPFDAERGGDGDLGVGLEGEAQDGLRTRGLELGALCAQRIRIEHQPFTYP